MDITLTRADQLTEPQLQVWRRLLAENADFDSPFFTPTFTMAVGQARKDVEIAVMQEQGECVGFLPFQRASLHVAYPVGWKINDFQGAIVAPGTTIHPTELLQACGLSQWRFDHLSRSQTWCAGAHIVSAESPAIELSEGFEGYLQHKKSTGDSRLKTLMRKSRKLEREIGPVRLVFHSQEQNNLDTLIQWKSEQLRRMRSANVLNQSWVREAIDTLHRSRATECRGALSALYSGDSLVAAHLGICNSRVLHWWFTTFDPAFERYSPGAILLLRLAEHCASEGMQRIDLGKGNEPYKRHFMTSSIPLAEGAIARAPWRRAQKRIAYRMTQSIRGSAWMRPTVQWMKRVRHRLANH